VILSVALPALGMSGCGGDEPEAAAKCVPAPAEDVENVAGGLEPPGSLLDAYVEEVPAEDRSTTDWADRILAANIAGPDGEEPHVIGSLSSSTGPKAWGHFPGQLWSTWNMQPLVQPQAARLPTDWCDGGCTVYPRLTLTV
jgi:hypothetical protein